MTEYTVHFQKGTRVGTRSLRMVHVEAPDRKIAKLRAMEQFPDFRANGYRITRVDHFDENGRIVID